MIVMHIILDTEYQATLSSIPISLCPDSTYKISQVIGYGGRIIKRKKHFFVIARTCSTYISTYVFCLLVFLPYGCIYRGSRTQSTYIYRAPQCMSPRWKWDSPTPLVASECALPPRTKGWGGTLACG